MGPRDFAATSWPLEQGYQDETPWSFEGVGDGASQALRSKLLVIQEEAAAGTNTLGVRDIASTGTAKCLVICVYPKDQKPADLTMAGQSAVDLGAAVTKYYQQASYGSFKVTFDVTSFFALIDNQTRYFSATAPNGTDPGYPNFINTYQILCEGANQARDAPSSYKLDSYDILLTFVHLGAGAFARAWGGGTVGPNFNYYDSTTYSPPLSINFTISKTLGSATIQDNSDWGRVRTNSVIILSGCVN